MLQLASRKYITGFRSVGSSHIISKLGCPNIVLGSNAEENFIRSLSNFQHENLEIVKVDEKCISYGSSVFWEEVSIVNDDIPMLLGNNILKPLEAEILLFSN